MTQAEATAIVLQLAESKWITRAWKLHKLTQQQIKAIQKLSAQLENGIFADGSQIK